MHSIHFLYYINKMQKCDNILKFKWKRLSNIQSLLRSYKVHIRNAWDMKLSFYRIRVSINDNFYVFNFSKKRRVAIQMLRMNISEVSELANHKLHLLEKYCYSQNYACTIDVCFGVSLKTFYLPFHKEMQIFGVYIILYQTVKVIKMHMKERFSVERYLAKWLLVSL